MPRNLNKRLN